MPLMEIVLVGAGAIEVPSSRCLGIQPCCVPNDVMRPA